jgi:hypothetical protein
MANLPPLSRADSDRLARKRRGRNIAMLVALVVIAVLFYAIAIVKLTGKMGLPQ